MWCAKVQGPLLECPEGGPAPSGPGEIDGSPGEAARALRRACCALQQTSRVINPSEAIGLSNRFNPLDRSLGAIDTGRGMGTAYLPLSPPLRCCRTEGAGAFPAVVPALSLHKMHQLSCDSAHRHIV